MRYSIYSILKVTTGCAVVLGALKLLWSWEPRIILSIPFMLVGFAFLGLVILPLIFVPLAILFAAQKGSQLDPKSVPGLDFLFRLWIVDLAIVVLFFLFVFIVAR